MESHSQSHIVLFGSLLVFLMGFTSSSQAYTFNVGGNDGWVLQPCDGLNRWAGENRFQVNDTIIFKYKKGEDSVLVVHKRDYYHCNKTSPIHNLTDGHSRITFTRPGEFFFISGQADNCDKGEKMVIVVLSPRPPPSSSSPAPAPVLLPPAPNKSAAPTSLVTGSVGMLWGFALVVIGLV
ncbi:PREDICTED: early nodulin-like protein 2 [Ipomoea nil]|uniref:early nodulin-like protein 2 n=1 Tax=Ipomoea nil TaxID=35883 RepID=UPI0009008D77|nr:PREDICTED: early nodulin-like protein 2 [Ipomoea nil]